MPLNVDRIEADLAVIGFGKGGKTLAATLGRQGQRVVMIEQSASMYGGTCINIGCVPTKSMVYRAEHLTPGGVYDDAYRSAVGATAELTTDLRAVNFAMLDNLDSVTVLTGHARFTDPHTLQVQTVGGTTITVAAQTVVVGTGSRPVLPDIAGLSTTPQVMTSTELLSLPELPARLAVLGGGYVGLEFAAMFARYGSEVTVLEHGPQILGREDADVAGCLQDILRDSGVEIMTSAEVTSVREDDQAAAVTYRTGGGTEHTVEADAVLVALGREPVTDDLGLTEAGVETTSAGAIVVDEYLRTSNRTFSRSAMSTAARSSPTSHWTTTAWCCPSSPATDHEALPPAPPSRTCCSPRRRWRVWASPNPQPWQPGWTSWSPRCRLPPWRQCHGPASSTKRQDS